MLYCSIADVKLPPLAPSTLLTFHEAGLPSICACVYSAAQPVMQARSDGPGWATRKTLAVDADAHGSVSTIKKTWQQYVPCQKCPMSQTSSCDQHIARWNKKILIQSSSCLLPTPCSSYTEIVTSLFTWHFPCGCHTLRRTSGL